jgi:hypothetical protein
VWFAQESEPDMVWALEVPECEPDANEDRHHP